MNRELISLCLAVRDLLSHIRSDNAGGAFCATAEMLGRQKALNSANSESQGCTERKLVAATQKVFERIEGFQSHAQAGHVPRQRRSHPAPTYDYLGSGIFAESFFRKSGGKGSALFSLACLTLTQASE